MPAVPASMVPQGTRAAGALREMPQSVLGSTAAEVTWSENGERTEE